MTDLFSGTVGGLAGLGGRTIGGVGDVIESSWGTRVVQVAVFAAIMHYFTSSVAVIQGIKNAIPGFPKGSAKLFNSLIFGFLMWVGIKFIFDPFVQGIAVNQDQLEQEVVKQANGNGK